jgi:ABC-type multidrug transport system ATPase subunit
VANEAESARDDEGFGRHAYRDRPGASVEVSPGLELRGVNKRYGRNQALRNLSLSLKRGTFHVLAGRNGAGKSTMLRILGRREAPDSGEAFVLGRSLGDDRAEHGQGVAYVSESTDYAVGATMRAFFSRFSEIQPGWEWAPFEATMQTMGIDLDKAFSTLSRGQRMQVACAAALAGKPRVLLLDEVTSVLDARARFYFVEAFGEVCRGGGTVLMATNIVSEARDVADRLLLLEDGAMKIDVSVAELSERFVRLVPVPGGDHAVFASPACVPVGKGEDGRPRWLIPRDDGAARSLPEDIVDRRRVTPEEAFIYFTARAA